MDRWWLIPLPLLAFPLFWCGVVWGIAQLGWARLAERYRTDEPPTGRRFRFTSGRVGVSNYNSALHVGIDPEGLHLSVPFPFRVGHPPVLIPWDEITDIDRRTVLWYTTYRLRIGTPHATTVAVPEKVTRAARETLPGLLSDERRSS